MNINHYIPLLIVILSNIGYHLLSKKSSSGFSPFLGLTATYGVACLVSVCLSWITRDTAKNGIHSGINLYNILMGVVIVGVEGGYILMYRTGWEISKASLTASICIAFVLAIIGLFWYREILDIKKIIGMICCIVGIILLNR